MKLEKRIELLRQLMRKEGIDYYYVPAADQHKNEYVPACWQRRTFISGFTGSAGDVLIGLEDAYLWTDGRYFLQAEQELPKYFTLMKQIQGTAPVDIWLQEHAANKVFAVDPKVISISQAAQFKQAMQVAEGTFLPFAKNLIDEIWEDRPPVGEASIEIWSDTYAGIGASEKIAMVRERLQKQNRTAHVITMLDAIAWLYNIRGNDVLYNPLVISYAVVTEAHAYLFIDLKKVSGAQEAYFTAEGITLLPYDAITDVLKSLSNVWIDPTTCSYWVMQQLTNADIYQAASPITLLKACKNKVEVNGMHTAHEKDACAMIKFMHWLSLHWQDQDELSVMDKLLSFRRQDTDFKELSFATIAGVASNSAIIHYHSTPATNQKLTDQALFLLDSGAQYPQGTTDITRVFHFGEPTDEEKRYYTLVLKGHLALGHAIFPAGTMGEHLDAFARQYLWQEGLDYRHGTGHGVGCYLCVHEGPQVISPRLSNTPLQLGMVVSNEPGVYFADRYGIRIENLCVVVLHSKTEMGEFYTFENLTLVPYHRGLIETSLLSSQEIAWVDAYHQQVYQTLGPKLPPEVGAWLKLACTPL